MRPPALLLVCSIAAVLLHDEWRHLPDFLLSKGAASGSTSPAGMRNPLGARPRPTASWRNTAATATTTTTAPRLLQRSLGGSSSAAATNTSAASELPRYASLRSVESDGYLRPVRHKFLRSFLTSIASHDAPPHHAVLWELVPLDDPAAATWAAAAVAGGASVAAAAYPVALRSLDPDGAGFARVVPKTASAAAWVATTDDVKAADEAHAFVLEVVEVIDTQVHDFDPHTAAATAESAHLRVRLRDLNTGGFLNSVKGGHIRAHGSGDRNQDPAEREPSTLFNLVPVAAAMAEGPDTAPPKPAGPPTGGAKPPPHTGGCTAACRWPYDEAAGGYPAVALPGPLATYVSPSMFRDLSDYVWSWPFVHFKETAATAPPAVAAKCLPPTPIIYVKSDFLPQFAEYASRVLKRPYVLLTGQSDRPASKGGGAEIAKSKLLVKWYAQNADFSHPKLEAVPIGLNLWEHAPEMDQSLKALGGREKMAAGKKKLLLVNFGNTHPGRAVVWSHFCGGAQKWATCSVKGQKNNVMGNPHLVKYYSKTVAAHKFVVSPRGNGIDTHRFWEAVYLGAVPIVLHSPLDALYGQVPSLIVKDYTAVTEAMLEQLWASKYAAAAAAPIAPAAERAFWHRKIEAVRAAALPPGTNSSSAGRVRCWGPKGRRRRG